MGASSAAASSSADCMALWNSSSCARLLSPVSRPQEPEGILPAKESKTPCTFLCVASGDRAGSSILEVPEFGVAGAWEGTYGTVRGKDPLTPSSIAAVLVRVIGAGVGLRLGSAPVGRIELFVVGARVAGAEVAVLVFKNGDGSGGRGVIASSSSRWLSISRPFPFMSFEYLAVGFCRT